MPDQARLLAQLENAAASITPYWPLQSFIAANPIQGLERLSFEEAIELGTDLFGGRGYPTAAAVRQALADGRIDRRVLQEVAERHDRPDLLQDGPAQAPETAPETKTAQHATQREAAQVNRLLIKWLAAFLEEGQAGWPMPGRERGFWRAWRALAVHDRELPERAQIASLPDDPLAALVVMMAEVPESEREAHFTAQLVALPGWSGYVKWRAGQRGHPWQQAAPITLADYLAVRLALSRQYGQPEPASAANGTLAPDGAVWLEAWEESYRQPLLARLQEIAETKAPADAAPAAQLIFCIDVRSEVFRRHLERSGPYETLGFAGFFGLPIAHQAYGVATAVASCPVLLEPKHLVQERPAGGCEHRAERHLQGLAHLRGAKTLIAQLKDSIATPFAFVETAGGLFGLAMAGRTLLPQRFSDLVARLRRRISPDAKLAPQIALAACGPGEEDVSGFSDAERIFYAEASLNIMGLTRDFAPLVLLCGHGGETVNNPFAAGLDCGACGGNHGGPNARVMAAILNDPLVRSGLAERGIRVPETTLFLAAQHNTTTDEMMLFDPEAGQEAHPELFAALLVDLARARKEAAAERCRRLPGATGDSLSAVAARAADWAQVRPEWGLARNAAFIVGHRALTRPLDLEGRSFLHSYDWEGDSEGQALEVILTAPMVVAEWINTQYYFSTVDNVAYGAGSKVTHNVVGTFGVMQGNASDLMTGLPAQSVMAADDRSYHEPLRLMTVVEAPLARVEKVVRRNDILQTLFGNGWVSLAVLDPETGLLSRRERSGTWTTVSGAAGPRNSPQVAAAAPQVA